MKKIVFVIEQLYGGGAERVTAALMNEMCRSAQVHLITTYCYDHAKDYPTDARIIPHFCHAQARSRAGKLLRRIAFLRKTLAEIDPTCVISLAGYGTNLLLETALTGKRIPLILSERNDPARFPASKPARLLRTLSYQLCDGLVFQTGGAQAFFPEKLRRRSVIICNPLTGELPPRHEGPRDPRIVNFCRLTPQKNLDLLIDAFADIAGEFPEMRLEIIGEGPERTHLEEKIRSLQLEDRIALPGYSERVFDQIRTASLFVSSSDYEGISNSMLEAIALGVPAICTDCPAGSAREVIRSGENGVLVPVGDRRALAGAMRHLLRDPQALETLSRNGCALRQEISAARIAEKWLDYIRRICKH